MLNNRNRKMLLLRSIHLVATIFILTIIFVSTTALVSASTSGNTSTTTNTTSVGEEQEAVSSMTTTATTNYNNPSAVLGNPFMIVEFETTSVNPINETYIEIYTVHNVTLIPPNATTTTTINATESANTTVNILPNGLALDKGQSLIVTEGDDGTAEQENATTTFVDISRMNPDGTGSGTGVVFFSTNSTGQLAFLNNMVGINDSEFSQGSGTIRVWEWKGGTLPFEIGGGVPTMENQTTISPVR
jgi:hypothetical protein